MSEKFQWPDDTESRIREMRAAGQPWWVIAQSFRVYLQTIRKKAVALGLLVPRTGRQFTPEEDAYIRAEWAKHTPVKDIATHLDRSCGVVRQRVCHYLRDLLGTRNPALSRMLHRLGPDVINAGATPEEAVCNIRERIADATAKAKESSNSARLAWQKRALADMHQSIANGVPRNEAIFIARSAGVTLERLGEEFTITRERVRQICERAAFDLGTREAAE